MITRSQLLTRVVPDLDGLVGDNYLTHSRMRKEVRLARRIVPDGGVGDS